MCVGPETSERQLTDSWTEAAPDMCLGFFFSNTGNSF